MLVTYDLPYWLWNDAVVAWSGHATYGNYLRSTRYRCSETLGAYYCFLQGPPRSSKVLQGAPRCSKALQGPPRPRKALSYNRPWRTSDDLYMTYNNLGNYLQYICYLVGYLSSISNLATGLLTLCSLLETVTLWYQGLCQTIKHGEKWYWIKLQ